LPRNWAALRYSNHSALVSDLYILARGETLWIGDVVEFTTDPPRVIRSTAGEQYCYEVRRGCINYALQDSLTGTGADDAIGLAFNRVLADAENRYVSVIVHGFSLARACDLVDIGANEPIKCCSIGQVTRLVRAGLTVLEAATYRLGKAITEIPAGELGIVFIGD